MIFEIYYWPLWLIPTQWPEILLWEGDMPEELIRAGISTFILKSGFENMVEYFNNIENNNKIYQEVYLHIKNPKGSLKRKTQAGIFKYYSEGSIENNIEISTSRKEHMEKTKKMVVEIKDPKWLMKKIYNVYKDTNNDPNLILILLWALWKLS